MKKRASYLAAVLILAACASRPVAGTVERSSAPPPPVQAEAVAVSPGSGYVWIRGHWRLVGGAYVWQPGRWQLAPVGMRAWVPGRWRHDRFGWYWQAGHWR